MASILRSSKFVRYIAGFARNIVVNTPREFDGSFINSTQCLCGALPSSFATQASVQNDQNLERSLRRIDQDVRRAGRISRRDIDDVLEEIRNARSATSSQSLLVIRCCGNLVPEELPETRTKLVQEIWNTLKKLNVPMDVSHYNALLRVYLENEHQFSPTEFLSELESKGIEPNRVTYQRLIAKYCQIGDIEGATRILEFMREKQLPVNENVFNALINGHSQSGDMDSAQGILTVMAQAGLEPSADTYTTLLCGYATKGEIDTISSTIEECEKKEIYLLDRDYLDVIYALTVNGHKEHVPVILSKMRKAFGYGQDAINLILRLINRGHEDMALLVLKTIPRSTKTDGTLMSIGSFFIKQLVKANRPLETIVQYSKLLEQEQLYERGLLLAAETSLQLTNESLAYSLLEELQKEGIPIRQHYFWPLIISKAGDETGDGIINVLIQMNNYNIVPSAETVREYVIPNMKGKSSDIIAKLRQANVSVASAACSLVHLMLQKHEIEEAAIITSRVPAYYYPDLIKRPLTSAFYATKNLEAYVTILRHIYENLGRIEVIRGDGEGESNVPSVDKSEVVGLYLLDLANASRNFAEIAEAVLAEVVEQGLSITTTTAEKLQDKLGEKMTGTISDLLGKLSSGELQPTPIMKRLPSYTPSSQMNIPQLERLIQNLEAKNQEVKGLKRQLLTLYYRAKELEKLEKLIEEMKGYDDFTFTPGIYAQLMDIYAYHDKLEEATLYFNKLKEADTNFNLDDSKIIRYCGVLVKNNRYDEAFELLESPIRERTREEKTFQYNSHCWRILNQFAELGKAEELEKLFDLLLKHEFIEVNNVLLGPLVKVHLVNNDINKALEKFEWCCNQFKATPWKNELACRLIQSEDAEKLQKLTDLSTSVHGEINSLYDLVFAFVECGRMRQARKILETPGLQSRPQRINMVCQRYQQEGRVKHLEDLKDATKDLIHIDRSDIYYQLLLSYIKQDDTNKALGLWTQMQEEDLAPTDQFLQKLGNFLKERNIQVPFSIPQSYEVQKTPPQPTTTKPPVNVQQPRRDVQAFRQSLKAGQLDKALEIKRVSKENFSVNDLSVLIELLVQNDRQNEATKLALEMLDKATPPLTRVFRFLLNRLANNGDIESIEKIGAGINSELKKLVSFDNRVCHANLIAGKAEEYLGKLERDIDNAKDEELSVLGEKFPRGGAVGILEKHPELLNKYELVADKYAKRGLIAPFNVLWSHYYINGNDEAAEQIWKQYLHGAPRIMFQRVVQHAREHKDEALTRKLLDHLKTSNVTEGALGNAYSCLLDVLVAKGDNEEVVTTFENAVKDVALDYINRTAIIRVKNVYTMLNKPFNYKIPPKINNKHTSTTSNSSSDLESRKN